MPPGINIIHDVPVFCCNAVVSLLVTAAKIFIGRAELQVKRGLERRPVIQTLRMPQQTAHQAQQGEAKKDMWARKGNSRAADASPRAWPNIHFLQCRFLEVRCIEILDFFAVWFIHPLCLLNCQPQSSAFTQVCLHSLYLFPSEVYYLAGEKPSGLPLRYFTRHIAEPSPLGSSHAPRSTHKSNPCILV